MNMEKLSQSQVIQLAKTTGDVSGYDLSALNLTYLDLIGVQFKRSNLKGADLSNSNFSMSDFEGADLSSADLREATLVETIRNSKSHKCRFKRLCHHKYRHNTCETRRN